LIAVHSQLFKTVTFIRDLLESELFYFLPDLLSALFGCFTMGRRTTFCRRAELRLIALERGIARRAGNFDARL